MTEIEPFRGWRLSPKKVAQPAAALTHTAGPPGPSRYHFPPLLYPPDPIQAAYTLHDWQANGVLRQDRFPALYPYFQQFSSFGETGPRLQKGFIALVRLDPARIYTHESTMPQWVQERVRYMRAAGLQLQATHGLYEDPDFLLEHLLLQRRRAYPLIDLVDSTGIYHQLFQLTDRQVIHILQEHLSKRIIYLADGHHRLAAHKALLEQWTEEHGQPPPADHPLNFHMMYLSNMNAPDLKIWPTHRLVTLPDDFAAEHFLDRIRPYFHYQPCDRRTPLFQEMRQRNYDFGIVLGSKNYLLKRRDDLNPAVAIPLSLAEEVKQLDYTLLHYLLLDQGLGFPYAAQASEERIRYEKDAAAVIKTAQETPNTMGILLNELSVRQMKRVSDAGALMPQKSTYFYPKVLPGIVLSDLLPPQERSI